MMTNEVKLNKLYDYLFHYNPYQKMWYAFRREDSNTYFNGNKKGLMKHSDLDELVTNIIIKSHETKN